MRIFLFVFTLLILAMPQQATAQNATRELQQLTAMNRVNPLQNPEFNRSKDILDRRIVDRKNKVVGEVEDILIRDNGALQAISVDFNRLRLGSPVFLNYRQANIRPLPDGYELRLDEDEIQDFFPEFLANMETAAGNQSDSISLQKLHGIEVHTQSGRKIGKVNEVLFSGNGARVSALFVEITTGTQRGETVAIPYRSADFKSRSGRVFAQISNATAEAVLKIADN